MVQAAELDPQVDGLAFLAAPTAQLESLALLYRAVFGRAADINGLSFWTNSSATLEQVAAALSRSDEWQNAGLDPADISEFLDHLYTTTLGRAPGRAG